MFVCLYPHTDEPQRAGVGCQGTTSPYEVELPEVSLLPGRASGTIHCFQNEIFKSTNKDPFRICCFVRPTDKTFMIRNYFWKYASGTAILQWPPGCKTLKEAAAALITLVFCLFVSFLDWLFVFLWFVFLLFVFLLFFVCLFVCLLPR